MKKEHKSWKNYRNYKKGKEQLENPVLQSKDATNSIFDYIKDNVDRRMWLMPFESFKKRMKK